MNGFKLYAVFDVLTGEVATRLNAQRACVRDVSWHPFDQNIISTSVSFLFVVLFILEVDEQ